MGPQVHHGGAHGDHDNSQGRGQQPTGETSGTLDFALQSVSDYYNKIIPRRIKIVFAIFDPVMMISLIAVVGIVALRAT